MIKVSNRNLAGINTSIGGELVQFDAAGIGVVTTNKAILIVRELTNSFSIIEEQEEQKVEIPDVPKEAEPPKEIELPKKETPKEEAPKRMVSSTKSNKK